MRAAEVLAQAIRIRTVNPPGGEAPLAALLVDLLQGAGIEAAVVDTPTEPGQPGRAAAWARLPGTGSARPIVLLSHLDVVPADPGEWSTDPFAGVVSGGAVIGRGALDAKGVAVVYAFALIELARRGARLPRDVIFLATPDEETGGAEGAGYVVREHPELLRDAEYLLTEGGGIRVGEEGPPLWAVSTTEKSPCWLELSTLGTPGHSSAPAPDAAVPHLIAALEKVRLFETPIRVIPEVEAMFRQLAPVSAPEDREPSRDLSRALEQDEEFRRRFLDNRGNNALVRDTIAITVLEGSSRTNVAPSEARAHLDIRLLPGERCEDMSATIKGVIDDPGVRVRTLLSFPSNRSPTDTPLFHTIERVAAESDAGAIVGPRLIAGFTDAHWFRELGIVAYGFVPRRLSARDSAGIHGINERVSIENLEEGVRTLVRILQELPAR